MDEIVTTHQLTKRYGAHVAVDRLDLRVPAGCVYGFLGPNGSGKSTTMKMLLSLVTPTSGAVEVMGQPMTRRTRSGLLGAIGSLIEQPPGYAHLTGAENLVIAQRSLGLTDGQVTRAVHTVRLDQQLDKQVGNYSLGMKQRLGIALALAREPRLLILDEPTNGLDPAGIDEIRALLRRLADGGVTVIVSSHLLGEIDRVADMLGIMSAGRMLFQGTRSELFAAATPDLLVDTDAGTQRFTDVPQAQTPDLVTRLVTEGARIHGVRRQEQSLEDMFLELTAGGAL